MPSMPSAKKGRLNRAALAAAFLKPVAGDDQGTRSVEAVEEFRIRLDTAYGKCADDRYVMNCLSGDGTLSGLMEFAVS